MKPQTEKLTTMRLPWKKRKERAIPKPAPSFDGDLQNSAALQHHAVRALCGVLMNRHTACRSPHPFCGIDGHRKNGDRPQMIIAEAVPQIAPNRADLIGIYLSRANDMTDHTEEEKDILNSVVHLAPVDPVPFRKLVVTAPTEGIYPVMYGTILNPVEGDYSTGSIDPATARELTSNSEPTHCKWWYRHSDFITQETSPGMLPVLRFHCMQVFGEWWVVEVDWNQGRAQQVAALKFADNPEHNFGIHEREAAIYASIDDRSEYSRVIRENLPPTGF